MSGNEPFITAAPSRPLERVLTLLECVLATHGQTSIATLAQTAGLPKPTLYRLLTTLANSGLIILVAPDSYEPGPRLLVLLQLVRNRESH